MSNRWTLGAQQLGFFRGPRACARAVPDRHQYTSRGVLSTRIARGYLRVFLKHGGSVAILTQGGGTRPFSLSPMRRSSRRRRARTSSRSTTLPEVVLASKPWPRAGASRLSTSLRTAGTSEQRRRCLTRSDEGPLASMPKGVHAQSRCEVADVAERALHVFRLRLTSAPAPHTVVALGVVCLLVVAMGSAEPRAPCAPCMSVDSCSLGASSSSASPWPPKHKSVIQEGVNACTLEAGSSRGADSCGDKGVACLGRRPSSPAIQIELRHSRPEPSPCPIHGRQIPTPRIALGRLHRFSSAVSLGGPTRHSVRQVRRESVQPPQRVARCTGLPLTTLGVQPQLRQAPRGRDAGGELPQIAAALSLCLCETVGHGPR